MYFRQFPTISYLNFKNIAKLYDLDVLSRNILKRVSFTAGLKEQAGLFYDYDVEDGETPEILSDRIYGTPYYHWILLLFNDIIDPYEEWPKGSVTIDNSMIRKYPGYSMFLVDAHDGTGDDATLCGVTFGINDTIVKTNGTKDEFGRWEHVIDSDTGLPTHLGLVYNWDREYSRIDVTNVEGTFATGDFVGVNNEDGSFEYAMIMRITPSSKSLHHFEEDYLNGVGVTLEGERKYLDPLSSLDGNAVLGHTGYTGSNTSDVVKFSETRLGSYMGVNGSPSFTNVISKEEYEWNKNEDIRSIRILHPQYVQMVAEEFKNLLKSR